MKEQFVLPKGTISAPYNQVPADSNNNSTGLTLIGTIPMTASSHCDWDYIRPLRNFNPDFKTLQINIDTNLARLEDGHFYHAFPEWKIASRIPHIQGFLTETVNNHQPDVILVQEGRKTTNKFGDEIDSVTPIVNHLSSLGYQVYEQKYNPSDKAFTYITAIKQGYTVTSIKVTYFTAFPDRSSDDEFADKDARKAKNFGEEWEKSTFITTFAKDNNEYQVYNVHKGLSLSHRLKASDMLLESARQYLSQSTSETKKHVIMAGDFNSFPDWGGKDQLDILKTGGLLQDSTESLTIYGTNQPVDFTFISFPYDFAVNDRRVNEIYDFYNKLPTLSPLEQKSFTMEAFNNVCKAIGGGLDHALQHGFKNAVSYLVPTPINGNGPESYTEELVKGYILDTSSVGPAFISDHQPILTILGHQDFEVCS